MASLQINQLAAKATNQLAQGQFDEMQIAHQVEITQKEELYKAALEIKEQECQHLRLVA